MIYAQECAEILNLTPVRIKQIIKDSRDSSRDKDNYSRIKISHDEMRKLLKDRDFFYKKTVATIGAEKGGIGKSLLTCNVAIKKAQRGAKVLVIDLDPEACASSFFLDEEVFNKDQLTILEIFKEGLPLEQAVTKTKYDGIYIIPCRGKARRAERFVRDENLGSLFKKHISALQENFDLILFEVPPTFSNIIAAAYLASNLVIMPTFPDAWSLESLVLTIEDIKEECAKWQLQPPEMKIILNKYSPSKKASQEAWELLINEFHGMVLPFQIRESADLQNTINNGMSVFDAASPKVVKDAITMLADHICPLMNKKSSEIGDISVIKSVVQ